MNSKLELFAEPYLIARFHAEDECWERIGRYKGGLVSVTRTPEEVSLVIEDSELNRSMLSGASEIEPDWRAYRIVGPLAFNLVGILAKLTSILAAAEIPVFCLSTFLTDYILVKDQNVTVATERLRNADYVVTDLS